MTSQSSEQSPYEQLKARIHRRIVQEKRVDEKIVELVRIACKNTLHTERIVLSRTEHARLVQDVLRDVLLEILAKI